MRDAEAAVELGRVESTPETVEMVAALEVAGMSEVGTRSVSVIFPRL